MVFNLKTCNGLNLFKLFLSIILAKRRLGSNDKKVKNKIYLTLTFIIRTSILMMMIDKIRFLNKKIEYKSQKNVLSC